MGQKLTSNFAHALGQLGSKYGQIPFHVVVAEVVVVIGPCTVDVSLVGVVSAYELVVIGPLLVDVVLVGGITDALTVSCFCGVTPADLVFFVVSEI